MLPDRNVPKINILELILSELLTDLNELVLRHLHHFDLKGFLGRWAHERIGDVLFSRSFVCAHV